MKIDRATQDQTPVQTPQNPIRQNNGNNPINQKGFLPVILGVIILVLVVGAAAFYLGQQSPKTTQSVNQQDNISHPSPVVTSETQATQPIKSPIIDVSPIANGLYLGTYQGKEALFMTNARLSEHYENGVKKTSNDVGVLEELDGTGRQPFRYNELTSPIRITSFDSSIDIMGIGNFKLNSNKSSLYVIVDSQPSGTEYPNVKQELYQIDLTNYTRKQVWSHNIGDNSTYPKAGPAGIDIVESDKYAILYLGICYACEGFDPHGSVVLNLQTGAEKYIGEVGDFQFNLTNKTLSYKKLSPFDEACEPAPGCDNGKRTVYKPAGQVSTTQLP